MPGAKKVYTDFFFFFIYSLRLNVLLPPLPNVQHQIFLIFGILEEINGKKWSQIQWSFAHKVRRINAKK